MKKEELESLIEALLKKYSKEQAIQIIEELLKDTTSADNSVQK